MRWLWAARLPDGTDAVHDGDTVRLELDLGFSQRGTYALRLKDVFAPELRQPGGVECRQFVRTWLADGYYDDGQPRYSDDWPLVVETFRTKTGRDLTTLERYVAVVSRRDSSFNNLNEDIQLFVKDHPGWGGGIGA